MAEGKSFRLGDEVRYIQRRLPTAMGASSPLVSLFLFSTETGDAWLLDPSDRRAARLAGDGDPEPVHIEENDTCFVIDWKGNDRIEGPAFIYSDRQTRRVSTILGYVLKFQISLARFLAWMYLRLGPIPLRRIGNSSGRAIRFHVTLRSTGKARARSI